MRARYLSYGVHERKTGRRPVERRARRRQLMRIGLMGLEGSPPNLLVAESGSQRIARVIGLFG